MLDGSVVVIGNFDGVHPGHQAVIAEAKRLEPGLPLVVVTFWPHPVSVLHPDAPPMLLTSLDGRVEKLMAAGADRVEVIDFTRETAALSPTDFVAKVLTPLNPVRVVVGENFRFGDRALGTVGTLRELGAGAFEVTALALVKYGDEEICSTLIREALRVGDVTRAAHHLGRPFRFRGLVVHGDHRGRTLGFPTANLLVPDGIACPANGVYAGWMWRRDGLDEKGSLIVDGSLPPRWPAAISVGTNPTFLDRGLRRVEAYVLGRDDLELYDAPVTVEFTEHIRPMVRFNSKEELLARMNQDVVETRRILGLEAY
ncbi:MAG: bifunctional riboflavin kinase/FAD synthetase [Propionibacteriaceae bacterium]|jgi:riboflavin kinase/FMN adenylyltransferase|nr:bifunctional riboflavin kinase/FAD synthetase [Propionibacteriaceae bacterium]